MKTENGKEEFIERKIVIGLVVSDDFIQHIARVYSPDCLQSETAKTLAGWCLDYFRDYGRAPHRDIESIYTQKLKEGLQKDKAELIEDVLADLSDEYERNDFNADHHFDIAIRHFQECQAGTFLDKQRRAYANGDLDSFYKLQATFKPISLHDLFEDESVNAWDIYNAKDKPMRWLVEDFLPAGLTIVGGKAKTGKSYFLLNMAMALTQSKKMFGEIGFRARRGKVLYLALEDTRDRFKRRMHRIDADPKPELLAQNLTPKFQWDKLHLGGLQALEAWLKKVKRPKLIVIDTMAKVWGKKVGTGGGGLYAEEYSIYSPLADLAHRYEVSIIVVTHTKKSREPDVFDEILGGAGTSAPADNLIVLSKDLHRGPGFRRLAMRGKDIEDIELLFEVTDEGAAWKYAGEAGEVMKTQQRQTIYNLLTDEGRTMSRQEIRQALKGDSAISMHSVDVILRGMLKEGALEQPRYGYYRAPGCAGERAVNSNINLKLNKPKKGI